MNKFISHVKISKNMKNMVIGILVVILIGITVMAVSRKNKQIELGKKRNINEDITNKSEEKNIDVTTKRMDVIQELKDVDNEKMKKAVTDYEKIVNDDLNHAEILLQMTDNEELNHSDLSLQKIDNEELKDILQKIVNEKNNNEENNNLKMKEAEVSLQKIDNADNSYEKNSNEKMKEAVIDNEKMKDVEMPITVETNCNINNTVIEEYQDEKFSELFNLEEDKVIVENSNLLNIPLPCKTEIKEYL